MIITEETIQILDHSEELAHMILQSDLGQAYINKKIIMDNDEVAQKKISLFLKEKENFEEIQKIGKYHPDYKNSSKALRASKREMDMHDSVAEFKQVEMQLLELLENISRIVGHSVSDSIKVPSANPLYNNHHKNSCTSEGGCSCSG